MICQKCGTENANNMKFCKHCGKVLDCSQIDPKNKSSIFTKIMVVLIVITVAVITCVTAIIFISSNNGVSNNKSSVAGKAEDINSSELSKLEITEPATDTVTTVKQIKVSNYVGLSVTDAYKKLNSENITYQVISVENDIVAKDYVISQSPTVGNTINEGDKVILYVSEGSKNNKTNTYNNESNYVSEYILENSSYAYITKSDLQYMSEESMELALNEIYARHGRKFNSQKLQDYFNSKSWYKGTVSPEKFNEGVFNEYEKSNIALILQDMREKGYR